MTCRELEPELFDPGEAELAARDPARAAAAATHLRGCAACTARVALWRELGPAMREAAPAPPDALRVRRMENVIERELLQDAAATAAAASRGGWRARWPQWLASALAGAAVATVVGLAVVKLRAPAGGGAETAARQGGGGGAAAWAAAVTRVSGGASLGGRSVAGGARLGRGETLALEPGGEAELTIPDAARLRLTGPAALALEGDRGHVVLRLDRGTLAAEVSHRAPGETFWVTLPGGRVEVRGTRFTVHSTGGGGSSGGGSAAGVAGAVEVQEGRVLVRDDGGREILVGGGERAALPLSGGGEERGAGAGGAVPSHPVAPATCEESARACQSIARKARLALRAGDGARARKLVSDAGRDARAGMAAGCAAVAPCDDELGYLNAEALQAQGRLEAAARAFQSLDRAGAPPATRQNALYAAARLDQRLGRAREASARFERALEAAPAGALREEALGGAMESAAAAGDTARAAKLAARYLTQFPRGLMAPAARRLAGER